jgi:methyltransferase (TIGR00027 family)
MDNLSEVSETSLITLRSRVVESQKKNPLIHDEMGAECLEVLGSLLPPEARKRLLGSRLPPTLSNHIALRARKYDDYAREFIRQNPRGLVVSLGCGFDTRYWRLPPGNWKYLEVDLPPVVAIKREVLKDKLTYPLVGCSVLEERWIREVQAIQDRQVLLLAEGLFMYLPQKEVEGLFRRISALFSESAIVFEVVNKLYTQGIWKRMVEYKMKRSAGTEAGSSYAFGVKDRCEIESYGRQLRVVEQWSYFEDADIRPKVLHLFRNFRFLTRTQWTIKALVGPQE